MFVNKIKKYDNMIKVKDEKIIELEKLLQGNNE
jgi:hypothetical protein